MIARDRTGEPVEDEPDGHHCTRGWLGDPDAERPRPCLHCRPWLRGGPVDIPRPRRDPPRTDRPVGARPAPDDLVRDEVDDPALFDPRSTP